MTRPSRSALKRQAAQIYFALDKVMELSLDMREKFEPTHADLARAFEVMSQSALASQEILRRFWAEAWGQDNPTWKSWL